VRAALAVALAAALLSGCAHGGVEGAPHLGTYASFLPLDVAGEVPFVPSQLKGKVVLITFIATWCFPCLTELGVLSELQAKYGDRGLVVVLVGMDLEGHQVLDPFAQGYQLEMPLVVGNDALRSGDTPFGRVRELPSRILFGREGQFIVGYSGVADPKKLEKLIQRELDAR